MNEPTELQASKPIHERLDDIMTHEKQLLGEIREKLHVSRDINREFDTPIFYSISCSRCSLQHGLRSSCCRRIGSRQRTVWTQAILIGSNGDSRYEYVTKS